VAALERWRDRHREWDKRRECDFGLLDDPEGLLRQLGGVLGERKLRLFACACCRRLGHLMEDPLNERAVEVGELYADGLARRREWKKARKAAHLPWRDSFGAQDEALQAVQATLRVTPAGQHGRLCGLLRDLLGLPPRLAPVKSSWLHWNGGCVTRLARAIYEERRFEDLPVLADALEEAGCADPAILAHCRQEAEHIRGCWVVDVLTGQA
jgi:hypothetical protein